MIPFYIITGWLGSGKTTFAKNILNEYGSKKRIAVIQNEFAPSGVDGQELKKTEQPFELVEINNGSVFCVCQLDNFTKTLEKLANDYQPEAIFLEASGLADPISIAEILQTNELRDKISLKFIYTVIDALNFERTFRMMERFKHQVLVADKLIVNKVELQDNLDSVLTKLEQWNPFAEIIETSYCEFDLEGTFDEEKIQAEKSQMMIPLTKGGNKPDMGLSLLRLHDKISKEGLIEFIEEIKPTSQRIKGFVNLKDGSTMAVQTVYDDFQYTKMETEYEGRTELIIFNNEYGPRELQKLFKAKTKENAIL
ncbi:MAG: CobW family GTP-binding protein [Bacteroidota bacterium]